MVNFNTDYTMPSLSSLPRTSIDWVFIEGRPPLIDCSNTSIVRRRVCISFNNTETLYRANK